MLATNLQQLRRQHQLSQSQLSEILKVSRQMISKYETGQAEPDFTKLIVLADYFNITVDALIGHTPLTITEQPRTDGKVLIRSEITTELTSCYKF
ncbi:helix-turn-helix domain-containing protein [Lactiplantibacillus daowaiensis]|uniref:Helix-turn-helix domain-containing protein n=1 Tax=Lactiplantibacillus daowaiensis TaxID=2559918 RepID=A0ABW1S2L1_9LACO